MENNRKQSPGNLQGQSPVGGSSRGGWGTGKEVPVDTTAKDWGRSEAFAPRRSRRGATTPLSDRLGPITGQVPIQKRPQVQPQPVKPKVEAPTPKPERPREPVKPPRQAQPAPTATVTPVITKPAKKQRSPWLRGTIILAVVALVAGGFYLSWNAIGGSQLFAGASDYPGPGSGRVEVTVPSGATGTQIGQVLVDADVVASVGAFNKEFNANPLAKSVQPGLYALKKQMSAKQAVAALLSGANRVDNRVTYVEGTMVKTFTTKLVEQGVFTQAEIDKALADHAGIGLPAQAGGNVEGWLAPDTFEVNEDTSAVALFKKMIALTKKRLTDLKVPEKDWQAVLTKASIVEKEVGSAEYYGKVARVIDNRLDLPNETAGFLGMDTTVLYGLGRDGGTLNQADLEKDTPYNSRLHKGLPPTPIGSVGLPALEAAANPTPGPWLYFVTVNLDTGETKFSETDAQFQKDVAEFKAYCAANKGKC